MHCILRGYPGCDTRTPNRQSARDARPCMLRDTVAVAIQMGIDALTLAIEVTIDTVTLAIQVAVYTVALAVKVHGPRILAICRCALRGTIQPGIDMIALAIEAVINPVTLVIATSLDAITFDIEIMIDVRSVARLTGSRHAAPK